MILPKAGWLRRPELDEFTKKEGKTVHTEVWEQPDGLLYKRLWLYVGAIKEIKVDGKTMYEAYESKK